MTAADHVVLYRRPGCLFCLVLRAQLRRSRLPLEEIDIWKDPAGAAEVREHAGGDEVVPTVRVGDRFLVNPTMRAVRRAAEAAGISPEPRA